jgi:hypothetical protein
MGKPPAFQFYAKDWRSSSTVKLMNYHQRGLYIDMLAAAWDSDEPGSLPLPLEIAARSVGCDVRSLRDLLSKFPRCFVQVGSHLVNEKLVEQARKYQEISKKRTTMQMHRLKTCKWTTLHLQLHLHLQLQLKTKSKAFPQHTPLGTSSSCSGMLTLKNLEGRKRTGFGSKTGRS